jgi:hypothetical protein
MGNHRASLTLTLTGLVTSDLPFIEGKLLRRTLSVNFFKNYAKAGKSSCEFFLLGMCTFKKHHFMYVLLGQTQVIQKVGPIGQPQ